MKISSILAGVSGEYFVAAELSRRGYICSVTLKNTKGIDILVCNEDSTKTLGIQVKTNQINKREWILNEKYEKKSEDERDWDSYVADMREKMDDPNWNPIAIYEED